MDKQNALQAPQTESEAWLSALYDGELDGEESRRAVARLGQDAEAARRWSEYSLIGDAMRGCLADSTRLDARLRAALAAEPTVLAPMPASPPSHRHYYWLAAAASVAAIAWGVLSVSPRGDGEPAVPVAANSEQGPIAAASNNEVQAYLVAHQDYAYAVASEPEMRLTRVPVAGDGR